MARWAVAVGGWVVGVCRAMAALLMVHCCVDNGGPRGRGIGGPHARSGLHRATAASRSVRFTRSTGRYVQHRFGGWLLVACGPWSGGHDRWPTSHSRWTCPAVPIGSVHA